MSCHISNEVCGFQCTGSDESKTWKKIHDLPKEMNCGTCSQHADKLFRGVHDHVNLGLGKKIHDESNYKEFVNEVLCTCKKRGYC